MQNRHEKRTDVSACFSCLFIIQQMYEKGRKNGNKAFLHTSINAGGLLFLRLHDVR